MTNFNQARPITAVPQGNYSRMGYGTFPTSDRDWDGRIVAVKTLLDILDGNVATTKDNKTLSSLSIVRGMFQNIFLRDARDWFTIARQLGFPSSSIARPISSTVRELANAVLSDNRSEASLACSRLRELPVPEMLEHYLDVTVRAKHPLDETDFAVMLWSESRPWEVWVGATPYKVDHAVKCLKHDYPDRSPYGVVGAYLVHDAEYVEKMLKSACTGLKPREPGFYKCSLEEARNVVEAALKQSGQLRLSPWHGDEPLAEQEQTQTMKMAFK